MKRNVLIFGTVAGLITSSWVFAIGMKSDIDFDKGEIIGYTTMIVAFSLIFVAVKNYRDKYNAGVIAFRKAFLVGLYITLVASLIYTITWMIVSHFFVPDFMDNYVAHSLKGMKANGATDEMIAAEMIKFEEFKTMYANPFFKFIMTLLEIMPVGLLVSLLAAWILKRKIVPVASGTVQGQVGK